MNNGNDEDSAQQVSGGLQAPTDNSIMQGAQVGAQEQSDGSDLGFFPLGPRPQPSIANQGPMWNLLKGNMNTHREHAFRRVEDSNGYVFLPHLMDPGWALPQDNSPIPFDSAVLYAATGTKGIDPSTAQYTFNQLCRGEVDARSNPVRWETMNGQPEPRFCTHTLFPTKFTRTLGARTDTFHMSFYCFYSSNKIIPPTGSWTPIYKPFTLAPDATIDGESPDQAVVNIDVALLHDESALLAIMASCQNAYALSNAYITFIPRIDNALFRTSTHWSHPSRYTIGGASLGMAVFAAIKGWLPILYTGYLNAPMPGAKFISNPEVREAMSMAKYGKSLYSPASYEYTFTNKDGRLEVATAQYSTGYNDTPWYLNPESAGQDAAVATATESTPILSRMMAQPNFVESVGSIFGKLVYATVHGIPIFLPMQSSIRTDLVTFVSRFRDLPKAIQWMGMVPTYYTAAMMEDGYPMLTRIEGQLDVIPNIIMPLTMTDASALQLRLFNIISQRDELRVRIGSAGGATRSQQIKMFTRAKQNYIDINAAEYTKAEIARAPEQKRIEATRETAKQEGWSRGKTNQAIDTLRAEFKAKRMTSQREKETAKQAKAATVKSAVDAKRLDIKNKKTSDRDAKANIRTRYRALDDPTKADKQKLRSDLAAVAKPTQSNKQKYAAKNLSGKMTSQRLKRNADGSYSEDTKAQLRARRSANDAIIEANPGENPGQYSSKQRGEARSNVMQAEKEELARLRALTGGRGTGGRGRGRGFGSADGSFDGRGGRASAAGSYGGPRGIPGPSPQQLMANAYAAQGARNRERATLEAWGPKELNSQGQAEGTFGEIGQTVGGLLGGGLDMIEHLL